MHAVTVRIGHALARQAARLSTAVTEHARPPPSAAHLTARLGRATNVGAALGLVREHVGRADDILLAAMWSQLRKLTDSWQPHRKAALFKGDARPLLAQLEAATLARAPALSARALGSIVFAAGRLRVAEPSPTGAPGGGGSGARFAPGLLEALAPEVVRRLPALPPRSIASVLWAYAQPLRDRADVASAAAAEAADVAAAAEVVDAAEGRQHAVAVAIGAAPAAERASAAVGGARTAVGAPADEPFACALTVFAAAAAALDGSGGGGGATRQSWLAADLADVAWAFAAAGVRAAPVYAWLGAAAAECARAGEVRPREIAVLAWAFATAADARAATALDGALAGAAVGAISQMGARELAMFAWARASWPAAGTASARAPAAAPTTAPAAAASAATSTRGSAAESVERALAREIGARADADALSPLQLTTCLWALARTRAPARAAFDAGARAAARHVRALGPREVSNLAWALARAPSGCAAPLLAALEAHLDESRLAAFSARELSTLAWSVCVADNPGRCPALMRNVVLRINRLPRDAFSEADRSALQQAQLSLRLDAPHLRLRLRADLDSGVGLGGGGAVGSGSARSDSLAAHAAGAAIGPSPAATDPSCEAEAPFSHPVARRMSSSPPPRSATGAAPPSSPPPARRPPSRAHAAVSAALDRMHIAHVNKMMVPGLGYTLDVVLADSRIAVEIAGPHHYEREPFALSDGGGGVGGARVGGGSTGARGVGGESRRLQRSALLKWQHLERAGWTVVILPYAQLWPLLPRRSAAAAAAAGRAREADGAGLAPDAGRTLAGLTTTGLTSSPDYDEQLEPLARYLQRRLDAAPARAGRASAQGASARDPDEGAWAVGALDVALDSSGPML